MTDQERLIECFKRINYILRDWCTADNSAEEQLTLYSEIENLGRFIEDGIKE